MATGIHLLSCDKLGCPTDVHEAMSLGFFTALTSDSHYFYNFQEICLPVKAMSADVVFTCS